MLGAFLGLRRLPALALLAATLAGAVTPHRHSGGGDEAGPERETRSVQTTHDPSSRALHWHAILQILDEKPCWACHWNRSLGLPSASDVKLPLMPGRTLAALPPRSALSVARFTRLSRGPPSVL